MSRSSTLARSVAILLEEERADSHAIVDMALSLRVCDVDTSGPEPRYIPATDEELIEVGGQWDRRRKRWTVAATTTLKIVRVPRGGEQEIAARWLAGWFMRYAKGSKGPHWDDFRRVWSLLLEGGRRGGKSYLAEVALVMFCVMVPRGITWAISPTQEETDELEQGFRGLMPRSWYTFRAGGAGKPLQFKLANGSRILCLSGYKPRALKRGRVDMALYNEAQNMYAAGWRQLRGAVADKGGLVILAANPPDSEIGRWLEDVHERGRAEKIKVQVFKLTAATNPFVDVRALADMADENDDPTFRREVLGEFVPIGVAVFHAWSDSESTLVAPPAHWIDVTEEVTQRHLGRAFPYLLGKDFQATPHMVSSVQKLYRDPADEIDPANLDANLILVVVDEVVVPDANEYDLVDALEGGRPEIMAGRIVIAGAVPDGATLSVVRSDVGYDAEQCGSVIDASGFTQDGEHKPGRTSERWLREKGWRWLYYPDRDRKRNPDVDERCKVTNSRLKSASGRRRMFVLRHCVHTIRAMRSWENRNGAPHKRSDFAHVCDAVTYPVYRLFSQRRTKGKKPTYDRVRIHTRADDLRGL